MAKYKRIKTGMSYEKVKTILGRPGEEMARNEIAGTTNVMYQWTDSGGLANMNTMFQDDKLIQKAQFGLK